MPANNFEEDVRKKMEELRFVPSADVWTQVEDKIREDRKRRRFLFWLPLTGVLLGGLIWFAWPDQKGNTKVNTATTQKAPENNAAANNTAVVSGDAAKNGKNPTGSTGSAATTAATALAASRASTATTASTATGAGNSEKATADINGNIVLSKPITNEADYLASQSAASGKKNSGSAENKKRPRPNLKSRSDSKDDTTLENINSDATVKDDMTGTNDEQNGAKVPAKETAGNNDPAKVVAETNADKKVTANIPETAPGSRAESTPAKPSADSAVTAKANQAVAAIKPAKAAKPAKKKNKIEWGVTASGGASQQLEQNAIPPDVLSRAVANFSVYSVQNSNLKTGPAFSIGIVAAKQIGKTWRLQTGIQYATMSSRLPNANQRLSYGATASSNNPNYLLDASYAYAAGGVYPKNTTYTNRYQFIQVPVIVEKQFGVRSPLSVQAGLAAGYLSSVRALIYQPLVDQYLKDNSQYNKLQLSGILGVYWKFRIDQHWTLRAGPEVQYQLTDLMKSSIPLNDHLLTGALRITLMHAK